MCTLSWLAGAGGWHVHFNRDESSSRARALPPVLRRGAREDFIAPKDPDGGGTWIAATSGGGVFCLLNDYSQRPRADGGAGRPVGPSRGLVVERLASGEWSIAGMTGAFLTGSDLQPFHLFAFSEGSVLQYHWDGRTVKVEERDSRVGCFSSSSLDGERVVAGRLRVFDALARGGMSPELQERFHAGLEDVGRPESGVVMDRETSRTVSWTSVVLGPGKVTMAYRGREPDGPGFQEASVVSMPLARGRA